MKQRKIGRGLSSLLGDVTFSQIEERASSFGSSLVVRDIAMDLISPNPNQPRKEFDEQKIQELAESIHENGILQPIIVRQDDNGRYVIIAGERRYRAAMRASLSEIPCIIRNTNESDTFIISMIENIQRAGLNPVEEAIGYQNICIKYNISHSDIARMLGKSRAHITNMIGILAMPPEIQHMLISGELSTGHAKVLKKLSKDADIIQTAAKIKEDSLSVRALEKYIDDITNVVRHTSAQVVTAQDNNSPLIQKNTSHIPHKPHNTIEVAGNNIEKLHKYSAQQVPQEVLALEDAYNANYPHLAHIKHRNDGGGQVIIHYNNINELRDIMSNMIDMSSVYAK